MYVLLCVFLLAGPIVGSLVVSKQIVPFVQLGYWVTGLVTYWVCSSTEVKCVVQRVIQFALLILMAKALWLSETIMALQGLWVLVH